MSIHLALLACLLVTTGGVHAESCDTDCHDQCRVTLFAGASFIEPACHAKCEVAKQAACRDVNLPLPPTTYELTKKGLEQSCGAGFQAITNAVIAQCSNWDGRLDDQHLITDARQVLERLGIVTPDDFNGVQVRWCPLSGGHGMAPDRGRIYLDVGLKNKRVETASTLAHEVLHLRQYRRGGTDRFKCDYTRQYVECGGCQDRRNRLEREAYEFEDSIRSKIAAEIQRPIAQIPPQAPPVARLPPGAVMQLCGCWGFNPPFTAPEPRCSAGRVRLAACPGMCAGGMPYGYVCE